MPDKEKNIKVPKIDKKIFPAPAQGEKLGIIIPIEDTIDTNKPPKESAGGSNKSDNKKK